MHQDYKNPVIRWLRDRSLAAVERAETSRDELLDQIEAAEKFILGLRADVSYPAAEVVSEIVGQSLPEAGRQMPPRYSIYDIRKNKD